MMRRLLLIISIFATFVMPAFSSQEIKVSLGKGDAGRQTVDLGFATLTFEFVTTYSNIARVRIIAENTTMNQAILLFKYPHGEKELKRHKPKFEFEKTYPGAKGDRRVDGCKEVSHYFEVVIPAETESILTFGTPITSNSRLTLPLYLAKYNPKQLQKKGKGNTDYKILAEEILDFEINVRLWSEEDPDYQQTKRDVEAYLASLKNAGFCSNRKHKPSLSEQIKPYEARRDSLQDAITERLRSSDWMSTDEPYKAYDTLLKRIKEDRPSDHASDCQRHNEPRTTTRHSCGYCSLSAQAIYHQLDDIWQLLHAGKISRDAAVKKARGLYDCYNNSKKRKKDNFYGQKIQGFYNRIMR